MRRSTKQTVGRILQGVSDVLPEVGRVATKTAGSFLCELDTSRTIRESFVSLMKWLREKDCTVFYFIDDIDRASGDQIRDLLSELKLYVSHPGIIAVLGYDSDYVVNALRVPGILPQGTDPEKYLEKIVTIRRNVPTASFVKMREYATLLTQRMTNLITDVSAAARISDMAALLSDGNPRQLKRLILRFTNLIDSEFAKRTDLRSPIFRYRELPSALLITAAAEMGLLLDDGIRDSLQTNQGLGARLQEYIKSYPSKTMEVELFQEAISNIPGSLARGLIEGLRLHLYRKPTSPWASEGMEIRKPRFDWRHAIVPIISSAAELGFKILPSIANSSEDITVPPSTTNVVEVRRWPRYLVSPYLEAQLMEGNTCLLIWNKFNMLVLVSDFSRTLNVFDHLASQSALCTSEKGLAVWIIDEGGPRGSSEWARISKVARESSKGLKNPLVFLYTSASKIETLLSFLLKVSRGSS
ncbi:MAG: P-loop NTPase fold protein [Candidatus Bathyarchaeota archaeon]|nr:P-loop NTPase fold protein [Candidatus Bathyarchaeota archaeon]